MEAPALLLRNGDLLPEQATTHHLTKNIDVSNTVSVFVLIAPTAHSSSVEIDRKLHSTMALRMVAMISRRLPWMASQGIRPERFEALVVCPLHPLRQTVDARAHVGRSRERSTWQEPCAVCIATLMRFWLRHATI